MKTSGLICGQMVDFFFTSRGRDRFFEKLLYEVLETGGVGVISGGAICLK